MTTAFENAFNRLHKIEGDYVDNEHDSGGATRFGITEKTARHFGWQGSMTELPLSVAKEIYRVNYWDVNELSTIAVWSESLAFEVFECGVLCGPGRAAEFLQRGLNVFNRMQRDYRDIVVDGDIGNKTLDTLNDYLLLRGKKGELVLLRDLNALQGAFLHELAEAREKDETFVFGWFAERVVI